MNLVFSDEAFPEAQTHSVFLAGPSPRRAGIPDDRATILHELERLDFAGTVFIPIPRSRFHASVTSNEFANDPSWTYDNQIAWECAARKRADAIAFWIPRAIEHQEADLGMPAFTTNVEFGEDLHSGKMLYGRPDGAPKMRYLDERATTTGLTVHRTITSLCEAILHATEQPAYRPGGAQDVPLFIWHTSTFQSWYQSQCAANNRLDGAELLSFVKTPFGKVFSFTMQVNIWVASENRHKKNEVIHARSNTVQIVALHDRHTVLVEEFRSPVNNDMGMVWELPGGSSWDDTSPLELAQQELEEETGIRIDDLTRFVPMGSRQLAATFSTHRADVFAIELNATEFAYAQHAASQRRVFGESKDKPSGERCTLKVVPLSTLGQHPVDWSTLGMVLNAVSKMK